MTVSNLCLFKRSNGTWYILYKADGKTRWKSTNCKNKSEALEKLSDFKTFVKIKPALVTLSTFSKDFLSYASSTYAKGSVTIFLIALRHLQEMCGDCRLTAITNKDVDMYKVQRLNTVAPASVNVELRALRAIFNTALRWNLIETNPFKNVQLVRIPEAAPTFFTKDDFNRLLGVVDVDRFRDVYLFAVLTGMRRGEILDLKWSDINLEERTAKVVSSASYHVKAGKRRTVPLNDLAIGLLRKKYSLKKCDYVFSYRGYKMGGSYASHMLKEYVAKAGLDKRLHFHSLRHSHATWLVMSRVSIYEIQKLLGHSDISTTQIYSHLVSSQLHDAVNKITLADD